MLLELHHTGCMCRPCHTHCCELISRSRHAGARILRRRWSLNHVGLLLRLLGPPLLDLLLLLKHLPLLEKSLLSALKFSLAHLLPLQLVLQGGHTLACGTV